MLWIKLPWKTSPLIMFLHSDRICCHMMLHPDSSLACLLGFTSSFSTSLHCRINFPNAKAWTAFFVYCMIWILTLPEYRSFNQFLHFRSDSHLLSYSDFQIISILPQSPRSFQNYVSLSLISFASFIGIMVSYIYSWWFLFQLSGCLFISQVQFVLYLFFLFSPSVCHCLCSLLSQILLTCLIHCSCFFLASFITYWLW